MGTRTGVPDSRIHGGPVAARKSYPRELAETVLWSAIAILFLRAFVFQQSEIPSGSMENTLLIGDHVLVNRFLYAPTTFAWERYLLPIREVRRGDVVVFMHPPGPEQDFIKRVLGLPGETIARVDGRLLVNGLPQDEPYLDEAERAGPNFGPLLVPPGHYFLLGDHRSRSADSREWGPAPRELIKGRAILVLLSTSAAPVPGAPPGQVSPRSLLHKLVSLPFHSRWERWFSAIR